jgi:hypothetical protein
MPNPFGILFSGMNAAAPSASALIFGDINAAASSGSGRSGYS